MTPTDFVIARPWVAPVGWAILHSLDYLLTVVGAKVRLKGEKAVFKLEGSYELNPIFQKSIDRQQWISPRFVITLVIIGAALYLLAVGSTWSLDRELEEGLGVLLGVIVFTRVAIIGRHLHNIWLSLRIKRKPGSILGSVSYDRPTVYAVTTSSYLQVAVLLALAALIAPDPWLFGGAVGNALITLYSAILGWRAAVKQRRARPETK
jgi:hypothetical protein